MSKITVDCALLEQALEFTEFLWRETVLNDYAEAKREETELALRAALEQEEIEWSLLEATQSSLREHMAEIRRLRALLAQPVALPRVEAWAVFEGENAHDLYLSDDYSEALKMAYYKGDHAEVKPLCVLDSNCIQPDHNLIAAARAVLNRWHSPAWEWHKQGPTAELMGNLQVALLKYEVK